MFTYKLEGELDEIQAKNDYNMFLFNKNIKRHAIQSDYILFKEYPKTTVKFREKLKERKASNKEKKKLKLMK